MPVNSITRQDVPWALTSTVRPDRYGQKASDTNDVENKVNISNIELLWREAQAVTRR